MSRICADSSFLVALLWRHDNFHAEARRFSDRRSEDRWLWTPWQRVETFNTLRHFVRDVTPRNAMREADARAIIHRLETDVRLGYFDHLEPDWRNVMRTANELSVAHAFSLPFASVDLFHVAHAVEAAAEVFVTFDEDQHALARAAGLEGVIPG
jgi:predicted nucleic acid-binding protein